MITLILVYIVVGVLLWLAQKYIPMDNTVKRIVTVVVIVGLVLWTLDAFGLLALVGIHLPRAHPAGCG